MSNPLLDHIPAFEGQMLSGNPLSVTRIPNQGLHCVEETPCYNGAVIFWEGRVLMAYRRFNPKRKILAGSGERHDAHDIAISVLDANWMPIGEHILPEFPYATGTERYEDPRLFIFQGALWLVCVEILPSSMGKHVRLSINQRLFRLDSKFQIDHSAKIYLGNNFRGAGYYEKNWTFFSAGNRLFLLYKVETMEVYEIDPQTGGVLGGSLHRPLFWPYGQMKGGTSPIMQADGTWLKFVHSSMDSPDAPAGQTRRYSMSALTFSPTPPFNILKVSEKPVVWGTRHEAFCGRGNSQCVFPGGVVVEDGKFHVSAGINDTLNAVFHLPAKDVLGGMVDASQFYSLKQRYFHSRRPTAVTTMGGKERAWRLTKAGSSGQEGMLATSDPFTISSLLGDAAAKEISEKEYTDALKRLNLPGEALPSSEYPKTVPPVAKPPPIELSMPNLPATTHTSTPAPDTFLERVVAFTRKRPYDGKDVEGWATAEKVKFLAQAVLDMHAAVTVELGAFGGRCAIAMGLGHAFQSHGICHAIDAWDKAAVLEGMKDPANRAWWENLDFHAIEVGCAEAIKQGGLESLVRITKGKAHEVAKDFVDGAVDILHFDANHGEAESCRDLAAWLPKMKPTSMVIFDDTNWNECGHPTTMKAQFELYAAGWIPIKRVPASEGSSEWIVFKRQRVIASVATPEPVAPLGLERHEGIPAAGVNAVPEIATNEVITDTQKGIALRKFIVWDGSKLKSEWREEAIAFPTIVIHEDQIIVRDPEVIPGFAPIPVAMSAPPEVDPLVLPEPQVVGDTEPAERTPEPQPSNVINEDTP